MADIKGYGLQSYFNEDASFWKDVYVYGCLYLSDSCGLVFKTPNGNIYSININDGGNLVINNINITNPSSTSSINTEVVNGFTNEFVNNGYGTRTVSEGLPGGGASPDNTIGQDGDTWLVVNC